MPRPQDRVPAYCLHRASGQAVVTLNGRDIYLGPHGSPTSHAEYDRLIGEWLAAGRQLPAVNKNADLNLDEVIIAYWRYAEQYYRKDGQPTSEVQNIRLALRPVAELYGHTAARDFGPLALKAIQQRFIRDDICRNQINQRIGKIKRFFRWAVSEQLIPPSVMQSLSCVSGLRAGRTEARETEPVGPVDDTAITATLMHLPPVVADMVRLQLATGMRPGEIRALRPCDVDTDGEVWVYRPASHKTQHHGRERRIYIGPKGQDILRPYLLREKTNYCFRPCDSEQRRRQTLHASRTTPISQGNRPGTNRRLKPMRSPGQQYGKDEYNKAIRRACQQAVITTWHANQLRHAAATKLRAQFGIEAAQTILGHSDAKITLVYAEKNFDLAARIAREVG